ncbi:MAG: tRNA (adenosine(37)-N6)-dimethylallyltransferase MiaA [Pseudomonadota bacterium]
MTSTFDTTALRNERCPVLLIAGATAVGKSAFALECAAQQPSVIVNADSMQVYDALPILTAQPAGLDRQACPHKLYGVFDPSDVSSAARWAECALAEIKAAWSAEQLPIVVGGTGLYLRTLVDGISPIPDIDPQIRRQVRTLAEARGVGAVHEAVLQRDPELAQRLKTSDVQRLCRALEVALSTGTPLSDWQRVPRVGGLEAIPDITLTCLVLEMDRPTLYARCNKRLELMIEMGALSELEQLLARKLSGDLSIMRAVGVPPLIDYLIGRCSKGEALARAQQDTRRFAKRQLTWNRNQFGKWTSVFV